MPAPEHFVEHRGGIGHGPLRDAAISVRDLSFRYPDGTLALEGVNLHVEAGATLVIIGPNGGGKTTLLKILLGLLGGYTGEVRVAGLDPCAARARGDVIGWVPQRTLFNWAFPASLHDVVAMGLTGRTGLIRRPSSEEKAFVGRVLRTLELEHLASRSIGRLSGGQQQRAIIARALVPRPQILMLDEPTVGVDESGKRRLAEILEAIKREFGVSLVLVSHDLRVALSSAPRIACLKRELHFHDAPENLTSHVLADVYGCDLDGILPAACRHASAEGEEQP